MLRPTGQFWLGFVRWRATVGADAVACRPRRGGCCRPRVRARRRRPSQPRVHEAGPPKLHEHLADERRVGLTRCRPGPPRERAPPCGARARSGCGRRSRSACSAQTVSYILTERLSRTDSVSIAVTDVTRPQLAEGQTLPLAPTRAKSQETHNGSSSNPEPSDCFSCLPPPWRSASSRRSRAPGPGGDRDGPVPARARLVAERPALRGPDGDGDLDLFLSQHGDGTARRHDQRRRRPLHARRRQLLRRARSTSTTTATRTGRSISP